MDVLRASERSSQRFRAWLTRPRLAFFFAAFLLAQTGMFLYLESVPGMLDRAERVRGRDFLHFYLAGRLVAHGEEGRLYDQRYFLALQRSYVAESETVPWYPSVYPPTSALFFAPLGAQPYDRAVVLWWLIQLACFAAAGALLYHDLRPEPAWRSTAVLGFAAFYPLLNTFWNGQLSAVLLLVWVLALRLGKAGLPILAGLVFSLLALKPQLILAVGLWLLIRRDWKVILGVALGGLVQLALVVATLGVEVLVSYLETSRVVGQWYRLMTMAPDHQHALTGILTSFFGPDFRTVAMAIQAALTVLAGWWLFRVTRTNSRLELAAAVPFILLAIPHLLTYDLVYLLIAVVSLLSSCRERPGLLAPAVLLYAAATLAPLYALIGFSLVPLVLFGELFVLSR